MKEQKQKLAKGLEVVPRAPPSPLRFPAGGGVVRKDAAPVGRGDEHVPPGKGETLGGGEAVVGGDDAFVLQRVAFKL